MATTGSTETKTKSNEELGLELIKKIMSKPQNKTKEELISDITDLHQLYDKDVISYTKKINDLTGDLQIKNEVIKGFNITSNEMKEDHKTEIDAYEDDLDELENIVITLEARIEGKDEMIGALRSIITQSIIYRDSK